MPLLLRAIEEISHLRRPQAAFDFVKSFIKYGLYLQDIFAFFFQLLFCFLRDVCRQNYLPIETVCAGSYMEKCFSDGLQSSADARQIAGKLEIHTVKSR